MKKAEHLRIDAFELWCWRRLLRVPWTARRSNQSISVVLETQTLSLLLSHHMWPRPSWQPPRSRPLSGGRSWLLSLSTDLDLVAWLLLSAWESRSRGHFSCQVHLKSRVCYLRRMRADFEDSQPFLPHVHSSGTLGSGNGLSCVFSISTPLAFLIELCLAFARQEGVFLYVFVSFVAVYKILSYSATLHRLTAKWCRR